jgi:hypothetical protein
VGGTAVDSPRRCTPALMPSASDRFVAAAWVPPLPLAD